MKASKNETVANIVKIMRHGDNRLAMQQVVMREFADRIEAAHRREVEELRKCLREAIDMTCENNGTCSDCPIFGERLGDCDVYRWRKALEGTDNENRDE